MHSAGGGATGVDTNGHVGALFRCQVQPIG